MTERSCYTPSALRSVEGRAPQRAWAIGTVRSVMDNAYKRGPFFKEEEALECVGESLDEYIFEIPGEESPIPKWKWEGNHWKRIS